MNKKTQAFTLAEVLVTLSIIGIIAATAIPAMMSNTKSATVGPQLARGVEVTENGITNIFAEAQARSSNTGMYVANSISSLRVSDVVPNNAQAARFLTEGNTLFQTTQGLTGAREISAGNRASYMNSVRDFEGNNQLTARYPNFNGNLIYRIDKCASYIIPETINNASVNAYITNNGLNDLPSDVVIGRIFIDANGENLPNRLGKDLFLFGLTNSGKLVPAGSQAYNNNVFNEQIPLYTVSCANNVQDARSCAARVVNDSWTIKY